METNFCNTKLKHYLLLHVIGEGVSSSVYKAVHLHKRINVAVKVMDKEQAYCHPKYMKLLRTEISVLSSAKNYNIVYYLDSFESSSHIFIVTYLCEHGNLDEYLKSKGKLKEEYAANFLKQILNGFKGLHQLGAMHRDFKTANVLLHLYKEHIVCKIGDLGFAKILQYDYLTKTVIGTTLTMAPYILRRQSYGFKADIWSLGVVFYQMLFGKYPFKGKTYGYLLGSIYNKPLVFKESVKISDDAKDFLYRCLTKYPERRISWLNIHNHSLIVGSSFLSKIKLKRITTLSYNHKFYTYNSLDEYFKEDQIPLSSSKMIYFQIDPPSHKKMDLTTSTYTTIISVSYIYSDRIKTLLENILFINKFLYPMLKMYNNLLPQLNSLLCLCYKFQYYYFNSLEHYVKRIGNDLSPTVAFELKNLIFGFKYESYKRFLFYKQNIRMCSLTIAENTKSISMDNIKDYGKFLQFNCQYVQDVFISWKYSMKQYYKEKISKIVVFLEKYANYLKFGNNYQIIMGDQAYK